MSSPYLVFIIVISGLHPDKRAFLKEGAKSYCLA